MIFWGRDVLRANEGSGHEDQQGGLDAAIAAIPDGQARPLSGLLRVQFTRREIKAHPSPWTAGHRAVTSRLPLRVNFVQPYYRGCKGQPPYNPFWSGNFGEPRHGVA